MFQEPRWKHPGGLFLAVRRGSKVDSHRSSRRQALSTRSLSLWTRGGARAGSVGPNIQVLDPPLPEDSIVSALRVPHVARRLGRFEDRNVLAHRYAGAG